MLKFNQIQLCLPQSNTKIVENFSAEIMQGEFISLIGKSGTGKSTFLKMLAGFIQHSEGCFSIDGIDISESSSYERPVVLMFQKGSSFGQKTVRENLSFSLSTTRFRRLWGRLKSAEVDREVNRISESFGISHLLDRKGFELSGGELQRMCLCRALLARPKVLLLDEPFSALDVATKELITYSLKNYLKMHSCSVLSVTHNHDEISHFGQRVWFFDGHGHIHDRTISELKQRPPSQSVLEYFGTGFVPGDNHDECVHIDDLELLARKRSHSHSSKKSGPQFSTKQFPVKVIRVGESGVLTLSCQGQVFKMERPSSLQVEKIEIGQILYASGVVKNFTTRSNF